MTASALLQFGKNNMFHISGNTMFICIARNCTILIQILATQKLSFRGRTRDSITVGYGRDAWMSGCEMIARNQRLGRFTGTCDHAKKECKFSGLQTSSTFEVWLRTCSSTKPDEVTCLLRAEPFQVSTEISRKCKNI